MMKMTDEQFEENYPRDRFEYVQTNMRVKGTMGQTEIESFNIIDRDTGQVVLQPTRTEHTNLNGLNTTVNWNW
ncbi:hypothetical protein D3C81_1370650 [compost metagenome]